MRRLLLASLLGAVILGTAVPVSAGIPSAGAPALDTPPAVTAVRAALPDPGARGPYATQRSTVLRGWERVEVDMPLRVEDLAEVTYPVDAQGQVPDRRFPLVMLLHGRHQWCADVGGEIPDPVPAWCAPLGVIPVPSFEGYRYLADRLASQGRIVVSIAANGINAQDSGDLGATARALLVEYHLTRLAKAASQSIGGYGDLLVGRLDLSRTVLMGHSRGGEGVVRAAQMLSDERVKPFTLAGVIPLAPVAYARMAPPTVATVTILPACDGDVSDLQGETYLDRGRDLYGSRGGLRSSIWVPGANHNYFNTEWTPGLSLSETGIDDATYVYDEATGSCAPEARLTPDQERAVGLQVMSAAVRYAQDGDTKMLPLLDGSGLQPRGLSGITLRGSAMAGLDRLLLVPGHDSTVTATGVQAALCRGDAVTRSQDDAVCATGVAGPSADTAWLGSRFVTGPLPGRTAVQVSWQRAGTALVNLRASVNLRSASRLSARIVLDPASTGTVGLAVRDADGRIAALPTQGLPVVPLTRGDDELRLWAQAAWVDPRRFRGVDLTRVTGVGLVTEGTGQAWLVDASLRSPRPPGPAPVLPVAEIVDAVATVDAGQTVNVPVRVRLDRPAGERVRLRFSVTSGFDPAILPAYSGYVSVAPGTRRATVRVPVTMPEVVGPGAAASVQVAIYALNGATVGMFRGSLTVVPRGVRIRSISVESPYATASAGEALSWDFTADEPGVVRIQAQVTGAMMDLSDIDPAFLEAQWLPTSGPLTAEMGLLVMSEQVGPDRYRLSLPLSPSARPGATVDLAVTSVTGAATRELPPLTGRVS